MRHLRKSVPHVKTFSTVIYLVGLVGVATVFQNCSTTNLLGPGFQATFDPPSTLKDAGGSVDPGSGIGNGNGSVVPTPSVGAPRMMLNSRKYVNIFGCNATNWAQIPNMPDYFVGRLRRDVTMADPGSCAGTETYTLAWAKMNWATNTLELLGKLIDLNAVDATIQGKYRITTAYDPSIMYDGTDYWLAFECHGVGFVGTVASCMVPVRFTAPGGLDLSRGYVVLSGAPTDPASKILTSASVPKLLRDDDGRVYLYYSAVKMRIEAPDVRDWISVTVRGTELVKDSAGRWVAKGYGIELPADHPSTVEVMGVEDRPGLRKAADGYQIKKFGPNYVLLGSAGDCTFPDDPVAGCYRMIMRKSSVPLGNRIFNGARVPDHLLPSNSVQYFHFVTRPTDQKLTVAGWFATSYATVNAEASGYAFMDVADDSNFIYPSAPIEADPAAATVALTYRTILKREVDAAGLRATATALYTGVGQAELIKSMFASAEGASVYKTSLEPRAFVANAWTAVLGHAADANSLDAWSQQITSGTASRVDLLQWLTESDEFRTKNPNICPLYR